MKEEEEVALLKVELFKQCVTSARMVTIDQRLGVSQPSSRVDPYMEPAVYHPC
jgi:hypothetical protein